MTERLKLERLAVPAGPEDQIQGDTPRTDNQHHPIRTVIQKVLPPIDAEIRRLIESYPNGTHRRPSTVSRRENPFNRPPKNKQRGGVTGTPAALHRSPLENHFALAVIQASLWAVHNTAFMSNCW